MATRSTIAIENEDGSVTGIYCHWDGYLSNNGKILFEHYSDAEKVRELIGLGFISSLGIGVHPDPNEEHSFDRPQKNVCVFYGRDRGEKDQEAEKFHSWNQLIREQGQEYNYLFTRDGKWVVDKYNYRGEMTESMLE
jgi:hypothetical protein